MKDELLRTDSSINDVIEKYSNTVLRICLIYMSNQADAEDVFQNVFLKLCELHPTFNDEEHTKAWLITVAKNECKNRLKSFWRRNVIFIDNIILPIKNTQEKEVVKAVFSLPLKYRDIIYLFYYEDYKIEEISELLSMKQSTVKTRLNRGRTLLKNIFMQEGIQYE